MLRFLKEFFFLRGLCVFIISETQTTEVVTFTEWFLVLDTQTTRGVVTFSKWQLLLFILESVLFYRPIRQRA